MKVYLTIKATLNLRAKDEAALKKATPENQLATARLQGANVVATVERTANPAKPKVKKAEKSAPEPQPNNESCEE